MDPSDKLIEKCSPGKGRKKLRNEQQWKCKKAKVSRYSAAGPPVTPKCGHKSKAYQCGDISLLDVKKFHSVFYSTASKLQQDSFIIKHVSCIPVARRRPGNSIRPGKANTFKYTIRKQDGTMVPVCREAFMGALLLKKDRIQGVLKRHFESGGMPVEGRGGDRRSYANKSKRVAICKFIESFRAKEPHYCRNKSAARVYLPCELNIKKLWRQYNKTVETELQAKHSFFRKIFNRNYNIGFGSPKTDVCSTCSQLDEELKICTSESAKVDLQTKKRVHRLKYSAFYEYLREEDESIQSVSFDCQKNMLLPKLNDQSAYFSRQINVYNFTVVFGSSKASLTHENVMIYSWNESEYRRGANEIASCLFHALNSIDLSKKKIVRLFADGCGGQNKNSILVGMVSKWLLCAPVNVKEIEIYFPVVGHSFLPPDRVFARIEKVVRKREVILQPEVYNEIFSGHGKLLQPGCEVPIFDWKTAVRDVLKPVSSWHFQFSPAKRIFLKRRKNNILVQGEVAYRCTFGLPKSVLRRGKTFSGLVPQLIEKGKVPLNSEKVKDVCRLVEKHYGARWRELADLQFYVSLEARQAEHRHSMTEDQEEEEYCEPRDDSLSLLY